MNILLMLLEYIGGFLLLLVMLMITIIPYVLGWGLLAVGVVLLTAYICYRKTFYAASRKPKADGSFDMPEGEAYEPYREKMEKWNMELRSMEHEDVQITSFDGLTLRGKYYEYAPGAPVELMIHGYRGNAERDMAGGVSRSFKVGHSALVIDQRASGTSDGHVISFGVNERRDCRRWVDFMIQRFGPDVKIILTGISMGAATVMMTAGDPLPSNVVGVLADCGYSNQKDIICKSVREMYLPPKLMYPFVKLGAKLFGKFDLEEITPVEAMAKATVPVIFYHGESDGFVPCYMSRECYDACASRKMLVTIPNADHGLCYGVDPQRYLETLREFFGEK